MPTEMGFGQKGVTTSAHQRLWAGGERTGERNRLARWIAAAQNRRSCLVSQAPQLMRSTTPEASPPPPMLPEANPVPTAGGLSSEQMLRQCVVAKVRKSLQVNS